MTTVKYYGKVYTVKSWTMSGIVELQNKKEGTSHVDIWVSHKDLGGKKDTPAIVGKFADKLRSLALYYKSEKMGFEGNWSKLTQMTLDEIFA